MAHPYHHSLSSVKKWGGSVFDYLPLHSWFDLMWTSKSFFSRYSAEVVVPVVHRRGGACGPTGASTGPWPYLLQPRFAYGNHQRSRPTVSGLAPQFGISAVGGKRSFAPVPVNS